MQTSKRGPQNVCCSIKFIKIIVYNFVIDRSYSLGPPLAKYIHIYVHNIRHDHEKIENPAESFDGRQPEWMIHALLFIEHKSVRMLHFKSLLV